MAAGNVGFGDDPLAPGCYSQLLFADENSGLETGGLFGFASSFDHTPKMLCFGDYANGVETGSGQEPGFACMDASSLSSSKNTSKKRNGSGIKDPGECGGAKNNRKKPKSENSSGGRHAKGAKKEKLGERITALQQLVSPFGKTDTASVLHEALGYIRFLHDQVQVLSTPYLQPSSSQPPRDPVPENGESVARSKDDLQSRGLCLVPVDLTLHVADSNGADLWSSTAMASTVSSA